jgi:molybdopterin converting factor small subunit
MELHVKLFASLAEIAGCSCDKVELSSAADIAELWKLLTLRYPGLEEIHYRPLAVCDLEYVNWERRLEGVKEVAFLPPVSGG